MRSVGSWLLGVGMLLGTGLTASQALASPDLLLDGEEQSLAGTHRFRYVRLLNGAKLTVPPYQGDPTTGGRLEIIAHRILVDETSVMDASAAGYRGLPDANGEGNGGGKGALVSSDATGGGGHGAIGGPGVLLAGCAPIAGATGGVIAVAGPSEVTFGGAGAAAGSADLDDGGRGGNGGGAILLRASKIEIGGQILADGEAGGVYEDDSAGGGAGGGILIEASQWLSFGGVLRANGAPGGLSSKCEGGGGGGGVIRLFVPGPLSDVTVSQTGGVATTCANASGQDTSLAAPQDPGCLDLDGDGFQSEECGGTDCDDSDPNVKKGSSEVCNGEDDDCDGEVDEGADATCASGQCVDGACVTPDGGVEDASTDAAQDAAQDATQDVAQDAPVEASEDGGGEAGPDGGPDGGPGQPDGGSGEVQGTRVTLRGGCTFAGNGAGGAAWIFLGLTAGAFVRTMRRRSGKRLR